MRAWWVLLLLAIPAVPAQSHEHGGAGITIVSDLPDGNTTIGALNRFIVIAYGDDDVPDFHQDLPMRVLLNGKVIFELDEAAGHDYDGVRDLWMTFSELGTYRVEALHEGQVVAHYEGNVSRSLGTLGAGHLATRLVDAIPGGLPIALLANYERDWLFDSRLARLLDANASEPLTFEPSLAFSTMLRGREAKLGLVSHSAGSASLSAVHYDASGQGESPWTVAAWVPTLGSEWGVLGPQVPVLPPLDENAVAGSGRLLATFDPWTRVGSSTLQTIAVLARNDEGHLVRDVSFSSIIHDARGRVVWESGDGFAASGVWTIANTQTPGLYTLHVRATAQDYDERLSLSWLVLPPSVPAHVGTVRVAIDGTEGVRHGVLSNFTFRATLPDGQPFAHADLVVDMWGASVTPALVTRMGIPEPVLHLRSKIHTHGDGTFRLAWAPQTWGPVEIRGTPFALEPALAQTQGHAWTMAVNGSAPLELPFPMADQAVPSPAWILLVALGAVAVAWRTRRR